MKKTNKFLHYALIAQIYNRAPAKCASNQQFVCN